MVIPPLLGDPIAPYVRDGEPIPDGDFIVRSVESPISINVTTGDATVEVSNDPRVTTDPGNAGWVDAGGSPMIAPAAGAFCQSSRFVRITGGPGAVGFIATEGSPSRANG